MKNNLSKRNSCERRWNFLIYSVNKNKEGFSSRVKISEKYQKPLTVFFLVVMLLISLLIIGCKTQKEPVRIHEHEAKTIEDAKELSGEKYGYIKNIFQKEGNYFASIVFLDYQLKSKEDKTKRKKSSRQFPDSLEALELPDAYFVSLKGKSPEVFLVDKSVRIVMQTLNYDPSGNFKFNENIDINKFIKLFTAKEFERYKKIPFKINFSKNEINSITEDYFP